MRIRKVLLALVVLASFGVSAAGCPPDQQPTFPIHAAFYYPWFPEAWNQQGFNPFTNYHPSLGYYDGSDPAVVDAHIAAMRYGGLDAGIASWWGQGTPTDGKIQLLLDRAASTPFRWALYFEQESTGDPSVASLTAALNYIYTNYGQDTAYLRVNGRPVIFVYEDSNDSCAMATRWAQANSNNRFYVVLKVFTGFAACADQPDNWHQYGPSTPEDHHVGHSYTISPGFWKKGEASPRLARCLICWAGEVQNMVASDEPWQLVTTFNEWGEGSSVESATEWATSSGRGSYLDALHAVLGSN